MVLMEDYYIRSGDGCIIFLGDDGREHILLPGATPEIGSKLVVHPTTGDILTHGHEVIQVGETVIVVPLDDGDQAALKPAISQDSTCKPIIKWVHDTSYKWPDGAAFEDEYYYRSYDIKLSETFYRNDHDLNINMYFMVYDNERAYGYISNRWPYGAVSMGFGTAEGEVTLGGDGYYGPSPDVTWYWADNRSPYATLTGGPLFELNQPQASLDNVQYQNGEHYCYMDALNDNLCNSKFTYYSSLPGDVPIDYIHLQVRSNGSMYVEGYTKSFLQAIDFCRAVPSDCETRCYGGRNQYPPMLPHNLMRTPEDWDDLLEEEGF